MTEQYKEIVFVHPEMCKKNAMLLEAKTINKFDTRIKFKEIKTLSDEPIRKLPKESGKDYTVFEFKVKRAVANEKETLELPVENFDEFDTVAVVYKHPDRSELSPFDPETMHHLKTPNFTKQLELNRILRDAGDYYSMEHKKISSALDHYKALKKKEDAINASTIQNWKDTKDEMDSVYMQSMDLSSKTEFYRNMLVDYKKRGLDGTRALEEAGTILSAVHDLEQAYSEKVRLIQKRIEGTYEDEALKKEMAAIDNKVNEANLKILQVSQMVENEINKSKREEEPTEKIRKKATSEIVESQPEEENVPSTELTPEGEDGE